MCQGQIACMEGQPGPTSDNTRYGRLREEVGEAVAGASSLPCGGCGHTPGTRGQTDSLGRRVDLTPIT